MNILIFSNSEYPEGLASSEIVKLMVAGINKNKRIAKIVIPAGYHNASTEDINGEKDIPHEFIRNTEYIKTFNLSYVKTQFSIFAYLFKRKFINKENDVVVYYELNLLQDFFLIICLLTFGITFIQWTTEKNSANKDFYTFKRKLQYVVAFVSERILPKLSKGVIVISSNLHKYYCNYTKKDKILLSSILVDSEPSILNSIVQNNKLNRILSLEKKIIVYSGTFGEKDGFQFISDAVSKYIVDNPDTIFVASGIPYKGTSINEIIKNSNLNNIQHNFYYLGLLSRNDLKVLINSANLLLVCRTNSEFANFGFPWKLGEYLMTKNPVIATRVGDIEKYFTDKENLLIAQPENSSSIYEKINFVFENNSLAKRIAENGYSKAIEFFDNRKRGNELIEFVDRISK